MLVPNSWETVAPTGLPWSHRAMDELHLRTFGSLEAEGWTSRSLRRACSDEKLEKVRRGVYSPPGSLSVNERHHRLIHATWPLLRPDSVISHTSAAVLHGLPVDRASVGLVEVTRQEPRGRTSRNVRTYGAQLEPDEMVELPGHPSLRVTSLERTVADLSRTRPFEWGVIAADAALHRHARPDTLANIAQRCRRLQGSARLREVLSFADGRAESAAESLSRVQFSRMGIPAPVLQFEVRDAHGQWLATVDFAWPELGVVGEVDGRVKYDQLLAPGKTAADVVMAEKRREELIKEAGYWIVRWGWAEACDPAALAHRVRTALARR